MSRRAVLSMPRVGEALVLDDEACRFGVQSNARLALERQKAEADEARQQAQHLRSLAQGLLAATSQLAAERRALVEQLDPQVVRLGLAIAARLIAAELDSDAAGVARDAAREALPRNVPATDLVRVRMHPLDRKLAAQALGEEPGAEGVEVAADPSVGRGGCVVDTHFGTIDATVETRWAKMVESLTAATAAVPDGPPAPAQAQELQTAQRMTP